MSYQLVYYEQQIAFLIIKVKGGKSYFLGKMIRIGVIL